MGFLFKNIYNISITLADDSSINSDFLHTNFGSRFFSSIYCHCLLLYQLSVFQPTLKDGLVSGYQSISSCFIILIIIVIYIYTPLESFVLIMVSKFCSISNFVYEKFAFNNLRNTFFLL